MRWMTANYHWGMLTLLLIAGCESDPAQGPSGPAAPWLSGIVTNPATLAPVAGAVVTLGGATATTEASGRYTLEHLTPGTATLRCTAPGYAETVSEVTVGTSATVFNISLNRIELFELGDFALFVPANVDDVRGVLLALGGPNTKSFATGEPFGAPFPEVEAALQTLGQHFREMAANRNLAILGTSRSGIADGAESDQLILDALASAEDASVRQGLASRPLVMYGMSGGAPEGSGFAARHPERVAGLLLKVPLSFTSLTGGEALGIPTLMILAEEDAFVNNAALTAGFGANRAAGALWAMAMESDVPHHSLSLPQRQLTLAWIRHVLDARIPANPSGSLRDLAENDGWLGDPATGDIAAWSAYPASRASASWLPSEEAAAGWRNFMSLQLPSSPGTFPDVSGVYDLTGVVTESDGWGYEGWQQAVALDIRHSTDRPSFAGTFERIVWTGTDGEVEETYPGTISGTTDGVGRIRFDLLLEGNEAPSRFEGTMTAGKIEGSFRAGVTSGTFTAVRRE